MTYYIVKVQYPVLAEPRYLNKDEEGWHTTGLDKCLDFKTRELAEESKDAFLTHIAGEGIPDVTAEIIDGGNGPFNPDWVTTPGSHIKEYFDDGHLKVEDFMAKTGFTQEFLDLLLKGEALITDEVAEKIASAIGASKQFWLNLESIYRDGRAKGKRVCG